MNKYQLTMGLNDKDLKLPKYDQATAYKITSDCIAKYTQYYTIIPCRGYYTHEDGTPVFEDSFRIEFAGLNKMAVLTIAAALKDVMNQESIMFEEVQTNVDFI